MNSKTVRFVCFCVSTLFINISTATEHRETLDRLQYLNTMFR